MWDPGPATIWETIDTKLKERNEGEFITVSEESECDEKDKDAYGNVGESIELQFESIDKRFQDFEVASYLAQ